MIVCLLAAPAATCGHGRTVIDVGVAQPAVHHLDGADDAGHEACRGSRTVIFSHARAEKWIAHTCRPVKVVPDARIAVGEKGAPALCLQLIGRSAAQPGALGRAGSDRSPPFRLGSKINDFLFGGRR
jgi:hypothetical protein